MIKEEILKYKITIKNISNSRIIVEVHEKLEIFYLKKITKQNFL